MLDMFVFWLSVPALGLLCAVIALRCFGKKAVSLRKREFPLEKPVNLSGERFTPMMGMGAICWGGVVLCAFFAVSALYCSTVQENVTWRRLYDVWEQWDARSYRQLAEFGYRNYTDGEHLMLVFFPLYPWLVHLLAKLIPNYELCGHLLSGICYLGSCYMLARMTTEEFGRKTGMLSLALFSAYPFSFFFAAYFTESLFLFLSLLTFYCIRRHRYLGVGVFGALSALTRMQGVLLAAVALVEWGASEHPIEKLRARDVRALRRGFGQLVCIALVGLGTLTYLGLNYVVEGNPFQFLTYQRDVWYQGFQILPKCLETIWAYLTAKVTMEIGWTTWIPEFALFFICIAAAVYGVRRLPPSWMAYFLLALMLNYSLKWPLSCGRYMASAFPLPVILAVACRKRPALAHLMILICTILQGGFFYAFLSGNSLY